MVQMTAEKVLIEVQTDRYPVPVLNDRGWNLVNDWARVTVTFWMVNQGSTAEQMQVLFPLANPQGWGDGWFNKPEIDGLTVQVDGKTARTTSSTLPIPGDSEDTINWAAFEATFPPGEVVMIEVRYKVLATGYQPLASFSYFLETGSG